MEVVYIGLGSNLGPRERIINSALDSFRACPKLTLVRTSNLYLTEPVGFLAQPKYLNAVAELRTDESPEELLVLLQQIEKEHGRQRGDLRWGPRTLDLDILLYGTSVYHGDSLQIPHCRLRDRAFVLIPLVELAPDLELPTGEKLTDLLQHVDVESVRPYGGDH